MSERYALVIENPQDDPEVYVGPGIVVVGASSYPVSRFCPDDELLDYAEDHYEALAASLPDGHPGRDRLMELQAEFTQRHAEARA